MAKARKPRAKNREAKKVYEGNVFDKIFRENAESIFLPLVEERLGIKIKTFVQMKEKRQTTLEREMDFFYEVETEEGDKFILHLEFQTENEDDMLYRNGEYHGIALRKKKMEIKHVVVFLGEGKATMPTQLPENQIYKGFDLINIHEFDSKTLLESQIPDVVLLTILADYPKEQVRSVIRLILRQLEATCKSPAEKSKYFKQLILLSRLRKIEDLTTKITEEMPITFDLETDILYRQGKIKGELEGELKGELKGIETGRLDTAKNLIENTDFSDEKIAFLTSVSVTIVKKMRLDLKRH
jgi:predicted transposase YdaD